MIRGSESRVFTLSDTRQGSGGCQSRHNEKKMDSYPVARFLLTPRSALNKLELGAKELGAESIDFHFMLKHMKAVRDRYL